ncbi:acetyl-CoA synthetase-like protein [Lichtheimia hyalospora FSU 10163]|nr:acetyl-CoA synthetase-like protein [Lichtheimia hyalospora FSU 10163]
MAIWQQRVHIYYRFQEKASETPDRVFLIFENETYTYRQLEQASNQLAHWLLSQNVKPKDVVCMMHQNHPSFVVALLAISKIGAVPALINNNLSDQALLHCLQVTESRLFLFDPVYTQQVATMAAQARSLNMALYGYGEGYTDDFPMVTEDMLASFSKEQPDDTCLHKVQPEDPAMLIYTSGTTGLPKAAINTHYRSNAISWTMSTFSQGLSANDTTYLCLPLYHATGLLVSFIATLMSGGKVVLARKFSASRFWNDISKYNITVFHYVGELCRYLANQPTHPLERKHKVRLIIGNGMRTDVWKPMRERFGIQNIFEFYGASEGLGGFINMCTGELGTGAIGRQGTLLDILARDWTIVKIDPVTEELARDENGFCIKCKSGEPGELLCQINDKANRRFVGYYNNNKANEKKIARNVFTRGDAYFRSGDLIRYESTGYIYFNDRLGDTFRWHSENVATTEVSHVVGQYPGIAESNVYGVLVPHHDGRAGMAALVLKPGVDELDMDDFYSYLEKRLAKYAIPVFIRILPEMSSTGTFKQQKHGLREQGIDKVPEDQPLFWLRGKTFVPFGKEELASVQQRKAKL